MTARKQRKKRGADVDQGAHRAAVREKATSPEVARRAALRLATIHPAASRLMEPVPVRDLTLDGRTYDVVVSYNDVDGARLHEVTLYDHPPGSGLGASDLAVPLRRLAVEAVARAASHVDLATHDHAGRTVGGDSGVGGPFDEAIVATRDQMRRDQRTSWTPSVESMFLARYRELLAAGKTSIHAQLAAEFGITMQRSMTKLSDLRRRHGPDEVPKAPPGRRKAAKTTTKKMTTKKMTTSKRRKR